MSWQRLRVTSRCTRSKSRLVGLRARADLATRRFDDMYTVPQIATQRPPVAFHSDLTHGRKYTWKLIQRNPFSIRSGNWLSVVNYEYIHRHFFRSKPQAQLVLYRLREDTGHVVR